MVSAADSVESISDGSGNLRCSRSQFVDRNAGTCAGFAGIRCYFNEQCLTTHQQPVTAKFTVSVPQSNRHFPSQLNKVHIRNESTADQRIWRKAVGYHVIEFPNIKVSILPFLSIRGPCAAAVASPLGAFLTLFCLFLSEKTSWRTYLSRHDLNPGTTGEFTGLPCL
jgi:hypothetical protein